MPTMPFNQESGKCSFSGVVDFLVTKIPTQSAAFLLSNPSVELGCLGNIKEAIMSNIFEAKRDNIWASLPQATVAAALFCQFLSVVRGAITSGEQWVFFVYERHTDGTGRVLCSPQYTLGQNFEGLALVFGLLRDSIENTTSSTLAFFTTSCKPRANLVIDILSHSTCSLIS
ncbi:hypothetical protein EDD22DRAFT_953198 [Suillus occidentalis]|nr:hypothetical protein EDD22DRAFT_953198 [Suillus occidentalis]